MIEAQTSIREINEAREQDGISSDNEDKEEEDDEPHLQGDPKADLNDASSLVTPPPDKLDLQTRTDMLNADQRRIFEQVRDCLLHQKKHEDASVISNPFTCL